MADSLWKVVTRRERAPRSPRMERALRRLMLRYNRELRALETIRKQQDNDMEELN
jgi:hypothetical protein